MSTQAMATTPTTDRAARPVPEWRRRALAHVAATGRNDAVIDTTALVVAGPFVRPATGARR